MTNGYSEANNQLSEVRRENAALSDEIKDIMEQISEGGRSIHEIERQRKRLETEKRELQAALEEAEGKRRLTVVSLKRNRYFVGISRWFLKYSKS